MAERLLRALDARLHVVGTIDYAPRGAARLALAVGTIRPDRATWRARFHTGHAAHWAQSRALARRLRAAAPGHDIALQVHGWVTGQPHPYVLYVDQTRLMAERGWPDWMPIRRWERSAVLGHERAMYHGAAHILVMGEPARTSLLADYGVDAGAITVVGGGLMFDALPELSPRPSAPVITFVGRDFERKGGHTMLAAFARVRTAIPSATLNLVGVPRPVREPGVVNLGRVAGRGAMSELYRATRVFCMPSHYEPYGFVFAEAMAHGVPCVGTSVQSIPEILGHGEAGALVPPGDAGALADALIGLLRDDDRVAALGAAGRRHVERSLTWAHVAERAAPPLIAAARAASPPRARTSPPAAE